MSQLVSQNQKCCSNTSNYFIKYRLDFKSKTETLPVCNKCLSKQHYQTGILQVFCIDCNRDVTKNILKIISENHITKGIQS